MLNIYSNAPKAGVYIYTLALGPFEWMFNIEVGLN